LNPQHISLVYSLTADFENFAAQELAARSQLNYPPYGKLISFRIQGAQLTKVREAARILAQRAHQLKTMSKPYEKIEVLGPAEAALAKLRGLYRYHLLLKGESSRALNPFCRQLLGNGDWIPSGIRVSADVDPLHLL
jgi:primosomal protein N' (replication factor Y)